MTTIDLLDKLKESIDNLFLNERAIKVLNKIKVIESEEDLCPEFLRGFSRNEVIFKPKQQVVELYNFSGFDPSVVTTIGIYIEDTKREWAENLRPIGYFEYQTDINGEYINDHIEIEETKYSS